MTSSRADLGDPLEEVEDERRWPRCRAGSPRGPRRSVPRRASQSQVSASALDDPDPGGEHLAEDLDEPVVDLDRGHRGTGAGEREGERAEPGADLDHPVPRPDARRGGRSARRCSGSTTKFWPSDFSGRSPVLVEQPADLAPGRAGPRRVTPEEVEGGDGVLGGESARASGAHPDIAATASPTTAT